ncbi:MAG: CDC27 family protein [Brevundimonas sp.]|uniref:CDC27 family protein n=1 Tax=Brevundimonas sp. TaxID=1871086 RepID=UPI00391D148C
MTRTLTAAALAALIAAASPAQAEPLEVAGAIRFIDFSDVPVDVRGRSSYGLFLAGRNAMALGESSTGADYLAAAQAAEPDQTRLRDQAFTAALLAGDLDVAARLSPSGEGVSPTVAEAGRLVSVVRTYGAGDARGANAALANQPIGFPHARAGLFVEPWIAAAAGDWDRALAEPPAGADPLARLFARYHRALLLEQRRDYATAEAILGELAGAAPTAPLFRTAYGEFLERRGRRDEAVAVFDAAIEAGATDLTTRLARERAASRSRAVPAPTLREGAALGLGAAAAAALAEQNNEFAAVYLRLALGLDESDQTRLLLGQTLQDAGLTTAARATFAAIGRSEPVLYAAARQQMAWSYQEDDRSEDALIHAREALNAAPDDPQAIYGLAGLLTAQEQYQEALELLNGPTLNTAEQHWQVRFTRGAVYESLGRFEEAEAELWAALQDQPDNAEVLNYLGYMWVDSGQRVHQGAEMIARAVAAEPESGHIQDSLGWAQYRQGQYEAAVETLELAVSLEPGNAVINDHLGDAYWQVGRRREAAFQWSRALSLAPEPDLRAQVEAKLERGLGAVQSVSAVTRADNGQIADPVNP